MFPLLITNQLLYQLSYTSICENRLSPSKFCLLVQSIENCIHVGLGFSQAAFEC